MTNTVIVDGNKTLGEGDDGTVQCVEAAATITLPHEDNWKFKKEDEFEIVSNTDSTVNIAGQDGVTLTTSPSITSKAGSMKVKYQGENTYLIWGVVCLIITLSFGIFTYNDAMKTLKDGVVTIKYNEE